MAGQAADRELLDEVLEGAQLLGGLAENDEVFRAVIDAFRAEDGESMHDLLERHGIAERCEVVCHWLRSKEAVLLCLELAGPPPIEDAPDVRAFAEVAARVTADEELVELIAQAVQERDTAAWSSLIDKHRLGPFSHLLCHWVSTIRYRLVCDVVCRPIEVQRPPLIPELRAAGLAIGALAVDEKLFATAAEAVLAGNCEQLATTLQGRQTASSCTQICEWFCSWRCMLSCLELCRVFPIEPIESQVSEMLQFAQATAALSGEKGSLERLAAATLRGDVQTAQTLVGELKFERYCIQFCHWVCFLRCQLFCVCACPPQSTGVFTHIGVLSYINDVHSQATEDGLTISDSRAFFSTLRLNGGLDPIDGAPLIEYRFETLATSPDATKLADGKTPITAATVWDAVTATEMAPIQIGSFTSAVTVLFPFPHKVFETIAVVVNPAGPAGLSGSTFTIVPDAEGWVAVPPFSPAAPMVPSTGEWQFEPNSNLLALNTTTLKPYVELIDETGVTAGSSAAAPLQTDVYYGIRMRLRDQGDSGDGGDAGTCSHIAINNTHYEHISHHPYWSGGLFGAKDELAVASIGIVELEASPCSLLTESLTIKFTAAHSNLGAVSAWLEGPKGPYELDLSPTSPENPGENWFGSATPHLAGSPPEPEWTFAGLPPCAYLLKLSVEVLLTTGDSTPLPLEDYIAFCKGLSRA